MFQITIAPLKKRKVVEKKSAIALDNSYDELTLQFIAWNTLK